MTAAGRSVERMTNFRRQRGQASIETVALLPILLLAALACWQALLAGWTSVSAAHAARAAAHAEMVGAAAAARGVGGSPGIDAPRR